MLDSPNSTPNLDADETSNASPPVFRDTAGALKRIRIVSVDDHELLVQGLKVRIDQEPDLEFVGSLPNAEDLLDMVAELRPDIVMMDLQMPGIDPIEVAKEIHGRWPECRVVVLSGRVRDTDLTEAVRAGVAGFFSKSDDIRDTLDGIRRAHRGEFVLGSTASARSRRQNSWMRKTTKEGVESRLESLTDREREVLKLIGSGLTRSGIADVLGRSAKTIDGHRERIMEKLDIHSSPELVRFAIREGLSTA